MRIVILDEYYPEFLKMVTHRARSYDAARDELLAMTFGTSDFYSRALRALGHETLDIIVNSKDLRRFWKRDHGHGDMVFAQIAEFKPEVLFFQNLALFSDDMMQRLADQYILAGQCSCAPPPPERLCHFNVIFSSLPNLVSHFERVGVRAEYLPLAFDPVAIDRAGGHGERDIDIMFCGGFGKQWTDSLAALDMVAAEFPAAQFYGYGYENLPLESNIHGCFSGPAFGLDYYRLLLRSKIVINRHGHIAAGWANNLRMFEATGCGAALITDNIEGIDEFFDESEYESYDSPENLVSKIRWLLENDDARSDMAARAQEKTFFEHTYAQRIPLVADTLKDVAKTFLTYAHV